MHTTTSGGKKCKEDILFKKNLDCEAWRRDHRGL